MKKRTDIDMVIRPETEDDFRETEFLTREAFWDLFKPGCDEHLMIHNLRRVPAFVPELDFVAVYENRIIGNIMYSKAKVVGEDSCEHEVLCMGPLSVLPSYQRSGIGSKLFNHSLVYARQLGFKAIIIFGHPDYYKRFGFVNAQKYHITTEDGENFDPFMTMELVENGLKGIEGKFYGDKAFHVDKAELEEFEKGFPFKESNFKKP